MDEAIRTVASTVVKRTLPGRKRPDFPWTAWMQCRPSARINRPQQTARFRPPGRIV